MQLWSPEQRTEYLAKLHEAPFEKIEAGLDQAEKHLGKATLGRFDRYYLLTRLLHRADAKNPWLYARCREVEAKPDGCLDLWAREHYKSTIITFAGVIQEILIDPEITICIFSHTGPRAKKFVSQIKREFESNEELQQIYPDILWQYPRKDAPVWSLEKGIVVQRRSNPKESTIEASGLVDSMPTGSHYRLRVYDDVVVKESVATPEQVKKTTESYELSHALAARGADGASRLWVIGTRYSFADTYQHIIDKRTLKVRCYPATDNGLRSGNPVFFSRAALDEKLTGQSAMSTAIFAAQMLQNPSAGLEAMFRSEWLKFVDVRPATLNVYILVDPAGSKKRGSDRTAMAVIGIDAAQNKWLLDGYRHRMGLQERWERMRDLRKKWLDTPGVQNVYVGYENYSIPDAIEHFEKEMEREGISFPITVLQWPRQELGSKKDRVERLEPDIRRGKFLLPQPLDKDSPQQELMRRQGQEFRIFKAVPRADEDRKVYTAPEVFMEELLVFPHGKHDDFVDACSRIYDMDPLPPVVIDQRMLEPEVG